ncbi:MAG TPA: inositol monophosphatase family protein [Casimicrobiaceae bacterium]|nr:inositol monophosphatase family protein [Casimicrobiaceae bacterium]
MNTTSDPILAVAVRAARRAASVIIDASRDLRRLPTFSKEHGDIVAAADAEAESAIVATISAAFPEHAILTGDSGEVKAGNPESPYRWIVDSIDGSLNFVHGFPYFAVSLALAKNDEITHAAILDPAHDELFTAIRDKGAQRNGAPMRVSTCTRLSDALVGTVFPTRKSPALPSYLPVFGALVDQCAGLLRAGSCALDLAHLASGRLDGFWVTSLRAWDVAAGALLVNEAGGRVGDFAGGTEFLRTNEVIAAAPGLFNPLREAIVAALPASSVASPPTSARGSAAT